MIGPCPCGSSKVLNKCEECGSVWCEDCCQSPGAAECEARWDALREWLEVTVLGRWAP